MSKPYDPAAPSPSRVVELLRSLGKRDSGPMPAVEPPADLEPLADDPGSGPVVTRDPAR
ncbi:MAG: hypothetical protein IPL61_29720 [Myxococcales bacterium]|nr:hypothetical protein [Myxococcales bacterium]